MSGHSVSRSSSRRPWRPFSAFLRRLLGDRRGGVAVFLALAVIPLVGFIGIGTDTARAYLVKSRLGSALDAAALAGGWSFFLASRDDDINMFFDANFPDGFLDATVSGPDINVDDDSESILLNASAHVPTSFMRLFGIDKITVYAEAEVTRKMRALDVVLSIDMSGSMAWDADGGGSRIEAARGAATEMITLLFGGDTTKEFLHMGLVPWNSKVNVMTDGIAYDSDATLTVAVPSFTNPETSTSQSQVYMANNSQVPLLSEPDEDWRGCVFNRYLDTGIDDDDGDIRLGTFSDGGADWPAWQPIFPGDHTEWGGEPIPGKKKCELAVDNAECRPCLSHGITPLVNSKTTIHAAVDSLLYPTGTTNITAGLGWAWRVLMPESPFTEAVADPDYELQRAIVLLSDGENVAGSGDGYKTVFGTGIAGREAMDDRLRMLAANVKAQGILVYVVQFANAGTDLQDLLKEVASGPQSPYYHYAPDVATLRQVFREVANHLSELRLSK